MLSKELAVITTSDEVASKVANESTLSISNYRLRQNTNAILALNLSCKRNMLEIAYRVNDIAKNSDMLSDDGFKDIFDYGKTVFGYAKSTVYMLIGLGERFVVRLSAKGHRYIYRSIFGTDTDDFNISQLQEMLQVDLQTAQALVASGVVTMGTSVRQIRSIIKGVKAGTLDTSGNQIVAGECTVSDVPALPAANSEAESQSVGVSETMPGTLDLPDDDETLQNRHAAFNQILDGIETLLADNDFNAEKERHEALKHLHAMAYALAQ